MSSWLPYLEHARRVGDGGQADRERRPPRQPRQDTEAIRRWARYQVSDHGRLPNEVVAAYQAGLADGALLA